MFAYTGGLQGDTGAQGIQGVTGDTGGAGVQGDTGEQGVQGEQGEQGDPGAMGFDSKLRVGLFEAQPITVTTWTEILWAVADYDGLSEFDAGNNRIVIAANGYYSFKYTVLITNLLANEGEVRFKVNGTVVSGGVNKVGNATYGFTKFIGAIDQYLEAGDLITMQIHHSKTDERMLTHTVDGGCKLCMHRFG